MKKLLHILLFISVTTNCFSQERVTTFGIVVKPVFPSRFFRTGPKESINNNVNFKISQNAGFSAGGVIRKGLTKTLSIEGGINFVKRLYELQITDGSFTGTSDYKVIGYEIPLQALVFVQLSRQIWMNAALGPSLDLFPSDVTTNDTYFIEETRRKSQRHILNPGVIADIGWEWRTEKSGYFYLGASYHRSLNNIYTTYVAYIRTPGATSADALNSTPLTGDYFTFDIRYYFHENAAAKKVKRP
ncbi:MAG: hypothetical protein ABI772_03610 [Bacteroidota bacterium]